MKAAVRHVYGPPESIRIEDVATPAPGDGEVLVRVHAASVNLGDHELLTGEPFYYLPLVRVFGPKPRLKVADPPRQPGEPSGRRGPFRPRYKVLGGDFAGTVEAVGPSVTRFKPGDEVFGDTLMHGFGAFAERLCLPEEAVMIHKPAGVSFEQAAAMPQGAFNALQAIHGAADVQPGQAVLVNGAGGTVGTLAVQLARARGARVTGVDSSDKEELIRSLGADDFIDYMREDFVDRGERYDVIFDVVAQRSVLRCRRALKPGGLYMMVGGTWRPFWQSVLLGPLLSTFTRRRVKMLMIEPRIAELEEMCRLVESGAVRLVIDRSHPLSETADAVRRVGEGRSLGKVIVTMQD